MMVAAAAAVAVAAGLLFVFVLPASSTSRSTVAWVEHTHEVIATTNQILLSAAEVETGQRGFLLTKDAAYLEPYERGVRLIWHQFSETQRLTIDNPRQQGNLRNLEGLLRQKMSVLNRTITVARGGDINGAIDIVRAGEGKHLMDEIRRTVGDITAEEEVLLQQRRDLARQVQQRSTQMAIALSVLTAVGFLLIEVLIARAVIAGATRRRLATEADGRQRLLDMVNVAAVMMREVDGTIHFWSEGCQRLYGYTAEQAIGQSSHELLRTVFPVSLADLDATLLGNGAWSGELRHRTRDGVEVIVSANKTLHDYADGSGRLVVETLTDVTMLRQVEARLRGSQAQFSSLVDTAADGFVIASGDGQILSVNRAMLGLFGYDRAEELVGRNLRALMPVDEAMRHDGYIAAHHAGAPPRVIGIPGRELRAIRRDGSDFPIDLSVSSFGDDGSHCLTGIIRDATARKQAEMALRDSEARLRLFIQGAPAAIAMFDITMCYLAVSQRFVDDYRIDNQARATLIGRSHYEVFPEVSENWRAIHRRVLAGETMSAANEAFPREDGHTDWVRWEMVPWCHADGTVGGAMLFSEDVTHQQIEKEQRSIIIEAAPSGIMIVDEAGTITLANSQVERIFGYPHGGLTGQALEILVPDGLRAAHCEMRSKFTSGQNVRGMERGRAFIGRKRDGSEVSIEILLNPVKTPLGRIVIASMLDVTERVRIAAEKEDAQRSERVMIEESNANLARERNAADLANQAKSSFLTSMTHELRTPLHGILGYAELLSLEGDLSPLQSERVAVMIHCGEHLLGMINAVLDVSQIEADRLKLHPVEIELSGFVRACLDVVRPGAEAKGLALVLEAASPLHLLADPTRLRQILINLLGNAIKFTPSGTIGIRLEQTKDETGFRLEVADTGPGIGASHQDKLFQAFERLDAEGVSVIEGTGIGLALSAKLVRLMGGRIGYTDNLGGGSVFWVELPANSTVPVSVQATWTPPRVARPSLRVLVVDDDALNRSIASGFLKFGGHEVICVDDGAAAVKAAAAEDFDVILMDVRMPVMNGLEATRRIRAQPGRRGTVPVVAATAQAFAEQIEICRQAGMNTHISKPFHKAALLAVLDAVVPIGTRHPELPAITASASTDLELPVFNRARFEVTTSSLSPEDIREHAGKLIARSEALLGGLRSPGMLTRTVELAEAAHLLAGSAGTFGFLFLADTGRRFEFAADSGMPETEALAGQLAAAIDAAAMIMRREFAGMAATAN